MTRLIIALTDQIPSGKNAMQVKRDGRHFPTKRFSEWVRSASYEVCQQKVRWPVATKMALPLLGDVVATISYRPLDKTQRDLPGMQDALWFLLPCVDLIENDGQIKGLTWDYPWRTEGPCVLITLTGG